MIDVLFLKYFGEGHEFFSKFRLCGLDLGFKLCLDVALKQVKGRYYITFLLGQVYPILPGKCICEFNIVVVTTT